MAEPLRLPGCWVGAVEERWTLCVTFAFSFAFAFAFPFSCSLAPTFGWAFFGAIVGAFLRALLRTFWSEFAFTFVFAFVFASNVERRALGDLPCALTSRGAWWGANRVWKRREVICVVVGGKLRERLIPRCPAAFGGKARTNLESSGRKARVARAGEGRAGWVSCGSWGIETVICKAIGLPGAVECRFGCGDCFRLVLLVLGDELGA